ncbi:unnamed protein product [Didymodactylos carnosus]|uniref:Uncharacterized protein n=1 Tax=Didymodactylos carnosus TaxID=1234261 RepID=A0A814L4F7_9BILA|nr:unnamed protein product [Didymodactylos carnosus]CAF1060852.1 unnamed protein product [Didymodactylos carnosus]CAF3666036.1 unnamed protein product [Didymodactylos carnosus]CAF3829190.1 unnamed protein product [Didymodactylos carnosus]
MSYVPRPYGARGAYGVPSRPVYGARTPFRPYGPTVGPVSGGFGPGSAGLGALGGTLGALGGTLGCLLCLAAIGALGLFATVVAITAYANEFLHEYKIVTQASSAILGTNVGINILLAASFLIIFTRRVMQHV